MKNKKIWKTIKKILRTICIWGVIALSLSTAVYAVDPIETTAPIYPYLQMRWVDETKSYAYVKASNQLNTELIGNSSQTTYRGVLKYMSALYPETFYHVKYVIRADSQYSREQLEAAGNGMLDPQQIGVKTLLFPVNYLSPYTEGIDRSFTENNVQISWSYNSAMNQNVSSYVGAKVYYYLSKIETDTYSLDCIMYFNQEFFQYSWNYNASHSRMMQCYLGTLLPVAGKLTAMEMEVYDIKEQELYNKLDYIASLITASGGGITEEDVKSAVSQAMQEEEERQRQEAQTGTQNAQQQAEKAMERYTAVMEQMKIAMAGIEDIKSIDTTTYTLTIGPFTNPMTGGVFPAVGVDFYTAYQSMPAVLKSTCPIVVTFFVLMAYAREFLDIFRHVEKTMHGEDE